jgi:hypothetical protein
MIHRMLSVAVVIIGFLAMSGSGAAPDSTGPMERSVTWLLLACLVFPAIIWYALHERQSIWSNTKPALHMNARALAASDARDLARMDSDKG